MGIKLKDKVSITEINKKAKAKKVWVVAKTLKLSLIHI